MQGTERFMDAFETLIPKPLKVFRGRGVFSRKGARIFVSAESAATAPVQMLARSMSLQIAAAEMAANHIVIARKVAAPRLKAERGGYCLDISPGLIELAGANEEMFFAGIWTLMDLAQAGDLPCGRITDRPKFAWRALQLDLARQMEKPAKIAQIIEMTARLKYNKLFLYGEGALQFESHPEITSPVHLTKREYRRLESDAAALGVELIPCIPVWGHTHYILQTHPELSELAGKLEARMPPGGADLCLTHPKTLPFIEDILAEYAQFISSDYIHIGGDESWTLGTCPRCRARARKVGLAGLMVEFFNNVAQIVRRLGKRPMLWSDMVLYFKDAPAKLDRDYVVCDWHYETIERHPRIMIYNWRNTPTVDKFLENGFDVLATPYSQVNFPKGAANVKTFAEYVANRPVLGYFNTLWEMRHFPFDLALPPAAYAAEAAWSHTPDRPEDFAPRFAKRYLGEASPDAVCVVMESGNEQPPLPSGDLERRVDFGFGDEDRTFSQVEAEWFVEATARLNPKDPAGFRYAEAARLMAERRLHDAAISRMANGPFFSAARGEADPKAIKSLAGDLRRFARRAQQLAKHERKLWRRDRYERDPNPQEEALLDQAKALRKLAAEVTAGRTKNLVSPKLRLRLGVLSPCWAYLKAEVSVDGKKFSKVYAGPQCSFDRRYELYAEVNPRKARFLRLTLGGYGRILIYHVDIVGPGPRMTPEQIVRVKGTVVEPECLLCDDSSFTAFGVQDVEPFFVRGMPQPESAIVIRMGVAKD